MTALLPRFVSLWTSSKRGRIPWKTSTCHHRCLQFVLYDCRRDILQLHQKVNPSLADFLQGQSPNRIQCCKRSIWRKLIWNIKNRAENQSTLLLFFTQLIEASLKKSITLVHHVLLIDYWSKNNEDSSWYCRYVWLIPRSHSQCQGRSKAMCIILCPTMVKDGNVNSYNLVP